MLDYELLKSINYQDVSTLNLLTSLAQKAKYAEELIQKSYHFRMHEQIILVWKDDCEKEFLTYDGIWQARYFKNSYDVECSAKNIFEYMKASFLVQHKFVTKFFDGKYTEVGLMAHIYEDHFKKFLERTAEMQSNNK